MAEDQQALVEIPASPSPVTTIAEPKPLAQAGKPDKGGFYWGTGRRKTAVARVRIRPGDGKYLVNGRKIDDYFTEDRDRKSATAPLVLVKMESGLDVYVNVKGGGYMGQAGAVLLGLSRALKTYDPTLEQALRDQDFLTRDAREVERKKYGQPGARKRFQFSKR